MTDFSITRRSIILLGAAAFAVFAATLCVGVAPAQARAISSHGYWIATQQKLNGEWVTTAQTEYEDGAIAAVVLSREGVRFRFQDKKSWDLQQGRTVSIRIWIDGDGYKGTATAINDSEYESNDLSVEFLKALVEGKTARAEIDGSTWTLKLRGLRETLGDAYQRFEGGSSRGSGRRNRDSDRRDYDRNDDRRDDDRRGYDRRRNDHSPRDNDQQDE